jgi:hypothetical protein
LTIEEPATRPLAVNMVLLVPEQTVVTSGPIDPFRGIPKVSGILLHLEDVADPPLTEATLAI